MDILKKKTKSLKILISAMKFKPEGTQKWINEVDMPRCFVIASHSTISLYQHKMMN